MSIELNKGQEEGKEIIRRMYRRGYDLIEVSGGPGTGKTTMIRSVIDSLGLSDDEVLYMAYMGKAVNVMRGNGLPAKTIHSSIYKFEKEYIYDENGNILRDSKNRYVYKPRFNLVGWLPNKIKLIVVDEAPMVPDQMIDDILSFGIPVIAVGDKDQLPPVFGSSRLFKNPDVVLTEIMRQAKGSPIIELAAAIRDGRPLPYGKWGKGCYVVDDSYLNKKSLYRKSDIIICGKNKTREKINNFVRRKIYGIDTEFPVIGDKMVCRKNNWNIEVENYPLTNGTCGRITYLDNSTFNSKRINVDFMPDFLDDCFYDIPLDLTYLFSNPEDRTSGYYSNGNLFEYAYAMTCQLSQGSQYDNVVIIEEKIGNPDFHKKWLYTAVTRAKKQVVLIRDPNIVNSISMDHNAFFKKCIDDKKLKPRKLFKNKNYD